MDGNSRRLGVRLKLASEVTGSGIGCSTAPTLDSSGESPRLQCEDKAAA